MRLVHQLAALLNNARQLLLQLRRQQRTKRLNRRVIAIRQRIHRMANRADVADVQVIQLRQGENVRRKHHAAARLHLNRAVPEGITVGRQQTDVCPLAECKHLLVRQRFVIFYPIRIVADDALHLRFLLRCVLRHTVDILLLQPADDGQMDGIRLPQLFQRQQTLIHALAIEVATNEEES